MDNNNFWLEYLVLPVLASWIFIFAPKVATASVFDANANTSLNPITVVSTIERTVSSVIDSE